MHSPTINVLNNTTIEGLDSVLNRREREKILVATSPSPKTSTDFREINLPSG